MGSEFFQIPNGWNVKPLVECTADQIISYGIVQPGSHVGDGVPILRVNNFSNNSLDASTVLKVAPEIEKKFSRTRLKGGEVLLTLVGSTGQSIVAPASLSGWNVARAVAVIRPAQDVGANWINICLQSSSTKNFLDSRANTTVQKTLNLQDVKQIPILIPPKDVKEFIESTITSLNCKIELNNQINTTLESMAQALFKSWFVDFDPVIDNAIACGNPIPDELSDRAERRRALKQNPNPQFQPLPTEIQQLFPSSFVLTEEMGWVPEGWELATLGKICELSGGQIQTGPFGSQLHASDYVDHGTPVVMPKDLQNRRINESTTAKINAENAARLSRHRMKIGDIVFSRRGDVEKHALIGAHEENWICGTGCLLVRPGSEWVSPSYISFSLDQAVTKAWLTQHAVGATMPNLNTGILSEVPVTLPANKILNFFEILVGTTEKQISANNAVAESLTKIRDELLPKLLSGQIQIPEAEALLNDTL